MPTHHSTPDPLALYIHWPFCKAKCPYCDFNSHVREAVAHDAWRAALLRELRYHAEILPDREVVSVFFGGGTPSLMEPQTVAALLEAVATHWRTHPELEITLEANPTSVEADKLRDFRAAGVNRVSLGVQALHAEALAFLGREHSAQEALAAVQLAGETFERMTFDLIYARPGQTVAQWEEELRAALTYARGHLSLYQLTIEPGTQFYHRFHAGEFALPEEEIAAQMFERTQALMEAHGMPAYEISNHAAAGQESRHNLVYWRGGEYAGIGPGAHGRIGQASFRPLQCSASDAPCSRTTMSAPLAAPRRASVRNESNPAQWSGGRLATVNVRSPEKWLTQVGVRGHGQESAEPVEHRALLEERLMMGLRLHEGVALETVEEIIDTHAIAALQQAGLLENDSERLRTTPQGRLVLNRLIERLAV